MNRPESHHPFLQQPFWDPHQIPLARPSFTQVDQAAIAEVVASGQLCQGERVARFEASFAEKIGARYGIATSSGSTAILVSLQAFGLMPEDEVIVPDMTFVSTATAAMYLGAQPVFVDITETDHNIDPEKVGQVVTNKTKGIIAVHYGGNTADMERLRTIAAERNLFLLEDAAGAHLSKYKDVGYAGTLGDAAIFSFTPTKPMTVGEGGMITTNDLQFAEKCRQIRNFGDRKKFEWQVLGFNFRMTEMAAALGLCQLERLDEFIESRRDQASYYNEAFKDSVHIKTPNIQNHQKTNYQIYPVSIEVEQLTISRNEIIEKLAAEGIASRLYYPALHKMAVFSHEKKNWSSEDFPYSLDFEKRSLALPLFFDMTELQQSFVCRKLKEIVEKYQR